MSIIVDFFAKEGLKAALKAIVFKDGKFSLRRTSVLAIWLVFAGFFYLVPNFLAKAPQLEGLDTINLIIGNLSDEKYLQLARFFSVTLVVAIGLLITVLTIARGQQRVAQMSEDEQNAIRFVKDVSLVGGIRCSNQTEKIDAKRKIAERIGNSARTKIMVINGYHDLARPDSEIRQALERKSRSLNLQVLLLDPFSNYAVDRARQLRQETDLELSKMRYIRDYMSSIRALDDLRRNGAVIEYRLYCSNPFFRMYIFDHDLILQTYQANRHGNETPMYHFSEGERSLFRAGNEFFCYYWDKGFHHEAESLEGRGAALTVYLGKLYGLHTDSTIPNDVSLLRTEILGYVERQKARVNELSQQGRFTDLDR